jgi:hypothetical protein
MWRARRIVRMAAPFLLAATAAAAGEPPQTPQEMLPNTVQPKSVLLPLDLTELLPLKPPPVDAARVDPRVVEAYVKSLTSWYSLYEARLVIQQESLAHNKETLAWNRSASRLVFWLVVAIVLSGVALCWVQVLGSRPAARAGGKEPEATNVEFALGRVRVSSPTLGVIVLTISLAFFYLYLTRVYSVTVVDLAGKTSMPSLVRPVDSGPALGAAQGKQPRPVSQ